MWEGLRFESGAQVARARLARLDCACQNQNMNLPLGRVSSQSSVAEPDTPLTTPNPESDDRSVEAIYSRQTRARSASSGREAFRAWAEFPLVSRLGERDWLTCPDQVARRNELHNRYPVLTCANPCQ